MATASDIDIARALVSMCESLNILNPGKEVLARPAYEGQGAKYDKSAAKIKEAILYLKAQMTTLDVPGMPLARALALTCDAEICAGLPTGSQAKPFQIDTEDLIEFIENRHFDFIFLCEYGLAPTETSKQSNGTTTLDEIIRAMLTMYHKAPSKDHARALRLWASRGLKAAKLLFILREPGAIKDTGSAKLFADILKDRVAADPINTEQSLVLMAARSDKFCLMAMMLAGADPSTSINSRPEAIKIINSFASNHGRLAMERNYGPLERHLLKHDRHSFTFNGETA